MAQKQILIICGEPSGDLQAALLVKQILAINPQVKISAVGGTLLKEAGAEIIYDIKDLSVMGFFDVLKKLPKFFALKKFILDKIKENKPELIVLVDFSGFNLRFAKAVNNAIPIYYYISPQLWASRAGRIKTIKKYISKMIVLFKFEEEFYKKYGVNTEWVGHPLLDIVRPQMRKQDFMAQHQLSLQKNTVVLLPGSRKSEIENILPIMLEAGLIMQKTIPDIQFVLAKATQVDNCVYEELIQKKDINLKAIEGKTYDCLNIADFALVCSGTATLETAIMQKPFLIVYKMNLLNFLLYRPQVKVPYIGMVNIVAGKKIVPEFIQFQAVPKKIAREALKILQDPSLKARMHSDLSEIKSSLGPIGAAGRAAQIILNSLR